MKHRIAEIGILLGNGLLFAEGDEWKKEKKILTYVFNFDFIKNQTPKIIRICDEAMDYVEKKHKKENSDTYEFELQGLAVYIFSIIMAECFSGEKTREEGIDGMPLIDFVRELQGSIGNLRSSYLNRILGMKFIKLGLLKSHRKILRKVKVFREWGLNFLKKRI